MLKHLITFSFLFLFLSSSSQATYVELLPSAEISVVSYNTFLLPRFAKKNDQKARARQIGRWLKQQDFDVVALQEVFRTKYYKMIKRELKSKYPYDTGRPLRRWYKPISSGLVIFSKYPLSELQFYHFGKMKHADKFSSKGVLGASVQIDPFTKVKILNTHLQAYAEHFQIREGQLKYIESIIKKQQEKHKHIIISGDFNIHERSREYSFFRDIMGYWDGPLYGEITHSYHGKYNDFVLPHDKKTLDYIFAHSESAYIYRRQYHNPKGKVLGKESHSLSDHLPVESKIRIP